MINVAALATSWMSVTNFGLLRDKMRGFLGAPFLNDPLGEMPDGLHHQMHQQREDDNESQSNSRGRLMGGEMAVEPSITVT